MPLDKDKRSGKKEFIMISKSSHFKKRQQQRGLRKSILDFILEFGEMRYARKATWLVVEKKKLPANVKNCDLTDKATQWLLIVQGGVLITCYRHSNPLRHLACAN